MSTTYPLSPLDLEAAPPLEESPNKAIKLAELEEEDDETYTTAEYSIEQQADYWESKWGRLGRLMGFLIRHGCEARGIQPVAIKDRAPLTVLSYLVQTTLFATLNANILTLSAGVLGPELFNLSLKSSVGTIIGVNAFACMPVAYFATLGPRLGLRQMILSRYTFGFWPNLIPAILNVCTAVGFLSLTSILGGQLLSLSSGGSISWSLGIVVVGLIGILPSFLGLRALHLYSLSLLPISAIIFIAIIGLAAPSLHNIPIGEATLNTVTTAGSVLGFASTLIGFVCTYASFASDFTSYLPPQTSSPILAGCVWLGLFTPLALLQTMGAAMYLVAAALPSWGAALEANEIAGLVGAAVGNGAGGKCLLVLSALIVTGNGSCTVYSIGLSAQAAVPWLMKVPRYFLAFLVTFIYVPIALALSSHFSGYLSNFLYILSYWISLYIAPVLWENVIYRNPVSAAPGGSYDLSGWDKRLKLPAGWAVMASWVVGVPAVTAGISQVWWVGWAARQIQGGKGDIGFILGFCASSIIYIPARYVEKRYIGR